MRFKLVVFLALVSGCLPLAAEDAWFWSHRLELRADYRWSGDETHTVGSFPPGAFLKTPDPGSHVELNVADVQLEGGYGELFAVRAKVHFQGLHRRNPTSSDRKIDADELFVRIGPYPEILERPEGTTFFLQAGKFPKMERQPVRLLESYGLAATSFNRFEDVQVLVGGTIGRNLYWRAQAANGNPLFFRDPNALAGDNGTKEQITPGAVPKYGSGFPILYNAETEDLFFNTDHVQIGEALGYRWQADDQSLGFDAIVFHYRRDMADREELTGTVYGGDLDLLRLDGQDPGLPGIVPRGLPLEGRTKSEYGARVYAEWHEATLIAQFTQQTLAGLDRHGLEIEAGYRIPLSLGPIESIQPAARYSSIDNDFGPVPGFPAPTIWWDWAKYDAGVRVGLKRGLDVTLEYSQHHIDSRFPLKLQEALVTVRWRV
ncbi:MAG: hypothetical protein ABI779_27890 [Acidobacteriota bacterium]